MKSVRRLSAAALLSIAAHACGGPKTYDESGEAAAPATESASVQPASVTADEFAALKWLIGNWRGSGGQYPAFYESYRTLNDSTIEQRAYSDSTFATATETSEIALRSGAIQSSSGGIVRNVVTRISGDSVYFARPNRPGGKFVWVKGPDGQWTAVLEGGAGSAPTVYDMRRIPSSSLVF